MENPIVFVSYAHDRENHKKWVLKLSTDLRSHGVDVILDQWDVRLGDDLPFFMEQGLSRSCLVLCICSDKYVEKTNQIKGGVGYEKRILSADLMSGDRSNFIIPLKRNNVNGKMPTFLGAALYEDFNDDNSYYGAYKNLLARIHNEDLKSKPPLGQNPFKSDVISQNISQEIGLRNVNYHNPAIEGKVAFDYTRNNGNYIIGAGDYQFTTNWSTARMGNIYCYKDKVYRLGYNPSYTDFPTIAEIPKFDFSSRSNMICEGQVVILENKQNKFLAIKVMKVLTNSVDIDHLLEFEYKIYQEVEL